MRPWGADQCVHVRNEGCTRAFISSGTSAATCMDSQMLNNPGHTTPSATRGWQALREAGDVTHALCVMGGDDTGTPWTMHTLFYFARARERAAIAFAQLFLRLFTLSCIAHPAELPHRGSLRSQVVARTNRDGLRRVLLLSARLTRSDSLCLFLTLQKTAKRSCGCRARVLPRRPPGSQREVQA